MKRIFTLLVPMGVALGPDLRLHILMGVYPAVNGNFFLPTYGTVLAAVSFDQSATGRNQAVPGTARLILDFMAVILMGMMIKLLAGKLSCHTSSPQVQTAYFNQAMRIPITQQRIAVVYLDVDQDGRL